MKKAFVRIWCAMPAIEAFGWSMLTGIIGTLILSGFLAGIMSLETLSILLPVIVGVNASISGYMLVDRSEDEIKRKKTAAAAVGTLVGVLSVVSVNALCFRIGGFYLMSGIQGLLATLTGIIGGWAGGTLAIKYTELKTQVPVS
jgi:hypothetical protein